MLAVESERVCSMSPENMAADFGTTLPFTQADPVVYSMADADSPASIRAGNTHASRQHTADRNSDRVMSRRDSRIFFCLSYVGKGLQVNEFVRFCALASYYRARPGESPFVARWTAGDGTGRPTSISPSTPSTRN